jgi:predicted transcriptional regulator
LTEIAVHRNLTVRLDEGTVRKAKIVAAKRSTSVSRLVAEEIDRLVREDEAYEQARVEALADLEAGFDLSTEGILPARGTVYDR